MSSITSSIVIFFNIYLNKPLLCILYLSLIHSVNICWVSMKVHMLLSALGIKKWTNQSSALLQRAGILSEHLVWLFIKLLHFSETILLVVLLSFWPSHSVSFIVSFLFVSCLKNSYFIRIYHKIIFIFSHFLLIRCHPYYYQLLILCAFIYSLLKFPEASDINILAEKLYLHALEELSNSYTHSLIHILLSPTNTFLCILYYIGNVIIHPNLW